MYLFLFLPILASSLDGLGITALIPLVTMDFSGGVGNDIISKLINFLFINAGIAANVRNVLLFILFIFFIKLILSFAQLIFSAHITTWLGEHLKRKIIIAYNKMKYSFYMTTKIGYFNNIITTEISGVVGCFKKLSNVIVSGSNLIAYLTFSFIINWRLTLAIIIAGITINISYKKIRRIVAKISYNITKANADTHNILIQFISNFKYLKATSTNSLYVKHLFPILRDIRRLSFRNEVYNSFTSTSLDFIKIVLLVGSVFYLVEIRGEKIAELIVPLVLIARSFGMILQMQKWWQGFLSKTGSITALDEAKKQLRLNTEKSNTNTLDAFNNNIRLINVDYSFNTSNVLDKINIQIIKGTCIGIAGPSGVGKTTLVNIIVGLLEPKNGRIEIDDCNYQNISKESLRSHFGYVTQEPIIFNDTIANNISFWDKGSSVNSKIRHAIDFAGCTDFVEELAEKEQTVVGDKGVKLSGGQRQRISIAREIYIDSDVIVFDEATASLDTESEKIIQGSINRLRTKKTIIIIAHRLSTLKICDQIIVLGNGSVIEKGTWDELVTSNGSFKDMCLLQGIHV